MHKQTFFAISMMLAAQGIAFAQGDIGSVAAVERQVTGTYAARTVALSSGDSVVQNEVVRTGTGSAAKIVFLDSTNLAIGASSSVTLDRFVYDGSGSARNVVFNAARGVFRFVSGGSPSRVYSVRTPVATIGVRGTIFDIKVERSRTTAVLQEGEIRVCTSGGGQCRVLDEPGQSVVVTARGVGPIVPPGPATFDFLDGCSSGSDVCTITRSLPAFDYGRGTGGESGGSSSGGSSGGGNSGGGNSGGGTGP